MADPEHIITRFQRLDSCVVSDAADALQAGAAVPMVRPMWEGAKCAGRAVTMRLAEGPGSVRSVHLGVEAIEQARPGDVIAVANLGRTEMGSWGGLLSLAASMRRLGGVVTDGALRDVDEARELRFPVFATAAVPRTARGRAHEESCGEPVELHGVSVSPGDLLVADGSGVVVIPWESAEAVLVRAEEMAKREALMAERLRSGWPPSTVLDKSYESMLKPEGLSEDRDA